MVAPVLATAAILGALVYPPPMGAVSESAGLEVAMAGAGIIGLAGASAIALGARLADARRTTGGAS